MRVRLTVLDTRANVTVACGASASVAARHRRHPARRLTLRRRDQRLSPTCGVCDRVRDGCRMRARGLRACQRAAPRSAVAAGHIAQRRTAYQATDLKQYRRCNAVSEAMHDHEIGDVRERQQHPRVELDFTVRIRMQSVRHNPSSA